MPGCAVAKCGNCNKKTKGTEIKYFRFPKIDAISKKWIVACRREDKINLKNACVCSEHFEASSFEIPLKERLLKYTYKNSRHLKPDAVPTLKLPGNNDKRINKRKAGERSQRLAKRIRISEINEMLKPNVSKAVLDEPNHDNNNTEVDNAETNVIVDLKFELKKAQDEIQKLNEMLKTAENEKREQLSNKIKYYNDILATVFTEGQIKKLLCTDKLKKVHWSPDDIASAISLRSVSPKAYRYLRAHNYPLPAMSTLRKWVSNFDVNQGVLNSVLTLMKKKSCDFNNMERLCIISFDEVYLCNKMEIDKKEEQKVGSHTSCQTVMVRGLTSHWKQPIYYQYDQPMTRDILEKIISELYKSNFTVVGIVSDMGTGNLKLWSQLNVGHSKNCYFPHPENNSLKVFVYADVPHLLKLARSHLTDHGFVLENTVINKHYFESLLDISTSELTFAHKITRQHLEVKGCMRQRVRLAAELFSNTVAKAIRYCGEHGLMPKNSHWEKAAEIVQLFNDWFDLLNSRSKYNGSCPRKNAFGTDVKIQKELLNKMSEIINTMRIGKHKQLIPFQKGILLTNRSVSEMFDYLREKYSVEYILTSRLNQDVLEKILAYIRGMGGANDHPSPLDFKYRIRWFILGKHSAAIFTEYRNTEETNEECLLNITEESSNALKNNTLCQEDICLTQKVLFNVTEKGISLDEQDQDNCEDEIIFSNTFVQPQYLDEDAVDEQMLQLTENFEVKQKVNNESLKYIAGYVAYRYKNKLIFLGCSY